MPQSNRLLSASTAEAYLRDFHNRRPGATSLCFHSQPTLRDGQWFQSSYACLTSLVPCADRPHTVLDVACGDGYLLSLLAGRRQSGLALIGIDMSEGELACAQQRLGDAAQLIHHHAQSLPLADSTIDTVLCHLALMLMDDVDVVIDEIHRVMKPGGVFSAVVGASGIDGDAFQVWCKLLRPAMRDDDVPGMQLGDPRTRTTEGLQQLLADKFTQTSIEELTLQCDAKPEALWDWFGYSYDIDRMSVSGRAMLREQFLETVQPMADADGIVGCSYRLRQVTASAV